MCLQPYFQPFKKIKSSLIIDRITLCPNWQASMVRHEYSTWKVSSYDFKLHLHLVLYSDEEEETFKFFLLPFQSKLDFFAIAYSCLNLNETRWNFIKRRLNNYFSSREKIAFRSFLKFYFTTRNMNQISFVSSILSAKARRTFQKRSRKQLVLVSHLVCSVISKVVVDISLCLRKDWDSH